MYFHFALISRPLVAFLERLRERNPLLRSSKLKLAEKGTCRVYKLYSHYGFRGVFRDKGVNLKMQGAIWVDLYLPYNDMIP